jgi:glycosyltransferase involved in cell wall biosynthesis
MSQGSESGIASRSTVSRRPRALLVHSSDELYGSDRVALDVAAVLAKHADVEVWLPDDGNAGSGPLSARLRAMGIRVVARPLPILRRRNLNFRGLRQMATAGRSVRDALVHERFDLVYLTTSACLPIAPLARLARSKHVIAHIQEQWRPAERVVLGMLSSWCTQIVAVSEAARTAARAARPSRTSVVPNATPDLSGFRPAAATRMSSIAPGLPRYVVASRWAEGKGHATLLSAWELAGCPGELVILGGPPALGRPVDVEAMIAEHVTSPESVTVIGEVSDAISYFVQADAVVLPSDDPEGLGLVLVEAASAGIPSMASRTGGPEEVVSDGLSGWLFEPGNAVQLAGLFARLTRGDLARAGRAARTQYENQFTEELFRLRMETVVAPAFAANGRRR